MKMVTIYVDEVEWASVQKSAYELSARRGKRVSAGEFLMGLYRATLPPGAVLDVSYEGDSSLVGKFSRDSAKPAEDEPKDGEPCSHKGCLRHFSHPCEVCGRIGGRAVKEPDPVQKAAADLRKIIKRPFAEHKKPKKNSKQASCPECRAPAGHRPTCSKGGA